MHSGLLHRALGYFASNGIVSTLRSVTNYWEYNIKYNRWYRRRNCPGHQRPEQAVRPLDSPSLRSPKAIPPEPYQPLFSIIVPLYKTPDTFLRQMLDSVTAQTYARWELCLADGSNDSRFSGIQDTVRSYQRTYPNIKYTLLNENGGIAQNTNAALALAEGDFIVLLDHDDILAPNALYEIACALNADSQIDILYSDEDKTDTQLARFYDPYFKPDFNPDLLYSVNYITHLFAVRRSIALEIQGFSGLYDGAQDYDFILKSCEKARKIHHIPKILYHWRNHSDSTAGDPKAKLYAYDAGIRALQQHFSRMNQDVITSHGAPLGYHKVSYVLSGSPSVSILLVDCPPGLQAHIRSISTYKNFSFAAHTSRITGEYLIILYRVSEILTPDWIEQFLQNCQRKEIGLAGAKILLAGSQRTGRRLSPAKAAGLITPSANSKAAASGTPPAKAKIRSIAEAGLIYTPDGQVHSPFYKYAAEDPGYYFQARTQMLRSLVGPHCFMIKTSLFRQYAGKMAAGDSAISDSAAGVSANLYADVCQLCQRLTADHLKVVFLPDVQAVCLSYAKKKLPVLEAYKGTADPFYNSNFSEKRLYHLKN